MELEEALFFGRRTMLLEPYARLRQAIVSRWPDTRVRVQKTQIDFVSERPFCWVSRPTAGGRRKDRPPAYFIVTFGWREQIGHPRILEAVEPWPGRWTHHVLVSGPEEVDGTLMDWIAQSRLWRDSV